MAKKPETAKPAPKADRQGNPVDEAGNLKVEAVKTVSEMTDEDFTAPKRNVQLPQLPANVDAAIGAEGRPVVIKRNIFRKNASNHPELNAETSRGILERALYNPNLVGQSQPVTKPNYRVAVQTGDKNAVTILDIQQDKGHVEVVGWRNIDEKGFERLKRQAAREGGQFLILRPSEEEQPGALSGRPSGSTAQSIPQAGAEKQGGAETVKPDGGAATYGISPAMRTEHDFLRVMHDNQKPVRVPVGEVSLPDTQFKEGADPKTGVVNGQELKGEYFESAENAVVVYVRKDGTKELVTGRHRFDLAKQTGKKDILARLFHEKDGYTPEDMSNLDAISNIIDEKGSVKDYVRYFENAKPSRAAAESAGFLSRSKGRLAFEGFTKVLRKALGRPLTGAEAEPMA